jgi:sugar/nucleoside kinase (ribokinase family)
LSEKVDVELVTQVAMRLEETASMRRGTATIGFDGFTDTIVRVVRGYEPDRTPVHFRNKHDFGQEIVDLGLGNSSFGLTKVTTKMGGNAPNTAHALGRLGIRVNCVGMLGSPGINDLFKAIDPNCNLLSYAEPTHSTALEFEDGKLLLSSDEILTTANWLVVRDAIGLENLIALYAASDIVGFANWGEIEHATDIWEGIEREVLTALPQDRRRIVFFDLADPSRRDRDFDRLAALIARVTAHHETIMCLNRNEATAIARMMSLAPGSSLEALGDAIFAQLGVNTLLIREPRQAMAWTSAGRARVDTFHTATPRISTGGGDNFNAGYCFARLAGFDLHAALTVASAVAGLYVATADSPTRDQVVTFLKDVAASGASHQEDTAE